MSELKNVLDNWVDLHQHSAYSPLDGVPFPDQIVTRAIELGRPAVALTDHGSVSGHVLFEKAIEGQSTKQIGSSTMFIRSGEKLSIKPIFGVEAYITKDVSEPEQRKNHITVLAANQTGYRNLLHMVSESYERGFYYRPTIDPRMLAEYRDGLYVLSGCESGFFLRAIETGDLERAYRYVIGMRQYLGDRFFIELQHFPHMREKVSLAYAVAAAAGVPCVLTCDIHYLNPDDKYEQQLLVSIRDGVPIDQMEFCMHHAHPWEPDALLYHQRVYWHAIPWETIFYNTAVIGASIEDFRIPKAPVVTFPMEGDKIAYVRERCLVFLRDRGLDEQPEYRARLDRELSVISDKGYVDYFLVVADMVNWAKQNGIYVGPARGSAAGSLVCWGLRITEIDPLEWGLLFERFVDPTRVDLPDIDVDFDDERRAEVIQYLRDKYGAENVANISTFARFGGRSTLEDVARSYRIPKWAVDVVKRHLVDRSSGDQRAEFTIQDALQDDEVKEVWRQYPALEYATKIQGKIRHTGKHAAGVIVTSQPVTDFMAVYRNASTGESIVGVDWRDAAYLNLMKIDVLGIKELALIRMIADRVGMTLEDVYNIPLDDRKTIELFNRRDFLGIFQFEGLAVRSVADRIKFDSLREIADVNALARPGPLHAGATEAYIVGKSSGDFRPVIDHPDVRPNIAPTYGQIIYQESIMRILREIGGMDWQDVCDIRNIMGKSKGSEAFDAYWSKWKAGTVDSGKMDEKEARHIWECIRLYGKHSFNAAHAFAYGLLAYWSAYFKANYPVEYYWAQLNKTGDKDDIARFAYEAMSRGIRFAPVSWGMRSVYWDITDQGEIAPGWTIIYGIGPTLATKWATNAPYEDVEDFKKKNKYNGKRLGLIQSYIGRTVSDIYGFSVWERIAQAVPDRITVQNTIPGAVGVWAGRMAKINRKNRIEEYESRGRDTSKLNRNEPQDYLVITLEDETGQMMVYVSPSLYAENAQHIWANPNAFIYVEGARTSDIPLIMAQRIAVFTIEDEEERDIA